MRPTKYKPEFCQLLIDHRAKGLSYESFAGTIGAGRSVLYDWEKAHPAFLDAKKVAKEANLLTLEKVGLSLMTGKMKGNPAVWIFVMKNFHGWGDDTGGEEETIDGIEFVE